MPLIDAHNHPAALLCCLGACCLMPACATMPHPASASAPSNTLPAAQPLCDLLYPSGPLARVAILTIDGTSAPVLESRAISAADAKGRWSVRISRAAAPDAAAALAPADELQQVLILSRSEQGVLLHELQSIPKASSVIFNPPLLLLPASLGPQSPQPATVQSRAAATLLERDPANPAKPPTTRQARATVTLDASRLPDAFTTTLDIFVGPARIRRQSTYSSQPRDPSAPTPPLLPASQTLLTHERREFSVRAGPITLERESLTATLLAAER